MYTRTHTHTQIYIYIYIYTSDKQFSLLWGAMKNSVFSNNPHTIDDLRMAITEYILNVDRAIPNTIFGNTVWRVNKHLGTVGGHFEHYL
jgi:hypothetical protein